MPLASRIVMCAAGGGKTTGIVREAIADISARSALITYTRNNEKQIQRNCLSYSPAIPAHIEVMTWFTFLLRELARPYGRFLHKSRINGIHWEEGRSAQFVRKSSTANYYFAGDCFIYSDKIAEFICECDCLSGGAAMHRLAQRFDHIFIDEVQDLAGYDLDLLELILRAGITLCLVGDHRQATFKTNNAKRNSAFAGIDIIKKFRLWDKEGLAVLSYQRQTFRCNQQIADLGDSFFPEEPSTQSVCDAKTGHDGIFVVPASLVSDYVQKFAPKVLRFDKRTTCDGFPAMNFGESKGLTFDRVLIFPHGLGQKWLSTGNLKYVEKSAAKMYVAATRARHSVAFVFDSVASIPHAQMYS